MWKTVAPLFGGRFKTSTSGTFPRSEAVECMLNVRTPPPPPNCGPSLNSLLVEELPLEDESKCPKRFLRVRVMTFSVLSAWERRPPPFFEFRGKRKRGERPVPEPELAPLQRPRVPLPEPRKRLFPHQPFPYLTIFFHATGFPVTVSPSFNLFWE